jgi:hypothetical protein
MTGMELFNTMPWNVIEHYMDDELREEIHMELAPCTDFEFYMAYCEAHRRKFGTIFTVN